MQPDDLLNVAPLRKALIRRAARTAVVLVAMFLLFIAGVTRLLRVEERVTLTSLSPDDTCRGRIVERPRRTPPFSLRFQRLRPETEEETLCVWAEGEGRPPGSERLIWSVNGDRLLLLGRHFEVNGAARLPNGEQMYVLYDVPGRKLLTNALRSRGQGFSLDDVRRIEWYGWRPPPSAARKPKPPEKESPP